MAHASFDRPGRLRSWFSTRAGNYEVIDKYDRQAFRRVSKRGELNEQPLQLVLERAKVGDPPRFPKLIADAASDRLFIATQPQSFGGDKTRRIARRIRTAPGATDGSFDKATFIVWGLAL